MADSGNKLGDAYVELRLRMDKLEADAAQAKPIIEKIAAEQEKIANNTRQSADAAGGWAASLNGVWATWNSIVSTVRSALSIGQEIGRVFVVNTEEVDRFIQAVGRIPVAMQAALTNAKVLEKREGLRGYEDLNKDYAESLLGYASLFTPIGALYGAGRTLGAYIHAGGQTPAQLRAELASLERDQRGQTGIAISQNSFDYAAARYQMSDSYRSEMNRLANALNANTQAILNNPNPR